MNDPDTPSVSSRAFGARAMRIFDWLLDAGSVVSAGLLICIMLATTVKVLFRYGLHTSLIGVDQISGTLMLYIAMLGAGWVLRRDEHVIVDLLLGHISERARALLLVASSLIGAAVCLLVAVFGAIEVVDSITRGIRIPAEIEMPRAVDLIVIPVGFLFLGLQFVRRALTGLRGTAPLPPPPVSVS